MLALRAWALRVLSGEIEVPPPDAPPAAARAVLDRERCALPLVAKLGSGLSPVIQQQALRDTQLTLIRDAPLGGLAQLGRERSIPVVVLKSAAQGTRLPSLDLDVLVQTKDVQGTLAHLSRLGYQSVSGYIDAMEIHRAHVPARSRPGDIIVEVHFDLGDGMPLGDETWSRLRPHLSHAGLFRLPAERHAWHVLWHSVIVHTHRRGELGDLLLIAEALSDLDSAGRSWLEAQVAAHPGAGALQRALRMADGLRNGSTPPDEFRAVAAAQYRLRVTRGFHYLPARMAKQLEAQWFELVEGGALGGLSRKLVLSEDIPSARPWLYRLERAAPWLTRAGRVAARAAVFIVTLPFAQRLSRVSLEDVRCSTPDA